MASGQLQVSNCDDKIESVPFNLKHSILNRLQSAILKQERKKANARYSLQRNIDSVITEKKLYDAFDSDATKLFTKDYRLKRIQLSQCLL